MNIANNYPDFIEKTLNDYQVIKAHLRYTYNTKGRFYSGIDTVDTLLGGFEEKRKYLFVSELGTGTRLLLEDIYTNLKLMYGKRFIKKMKFTSKYTKEKSANPFKKPILEIENFNISSKNIRTRDRFDKRPKLEDIPQQLVKSSDVIVALFRPEFYGLKDWDDREALSTFGEIEIKLLKTSNGDLDSDRLQFIGFKNKVCSLNLREDLITKLKRKQIDII